MEDKMFNLRLELISDPVTRQILDYLSEAPGYPDDVARKIGFTRSALEQRLKKLIEAGFVRKAVEQDTQRVVLLITSEAKRFQSKILEAYGESFQAELPQPKPIGKIREKESHPSFAHELVRYMEKTPVPFLVFILFEAIAVITSYQNFVRGAMNWVIISWLFWTVVGIISVKFTSKIMRKIKKFFA